MFCAVALFVIFTSNTEQARRSHVNAREDRKIFNPSGLQRIWIRSNCTPKSLKIFRVIADAMPLQNDACAIFAKEKWMRSGRCKTSNSGNMLCEEQDTAEMTVEEGKHVNQGRWNSVTFLPMQSVYFIPQRRSIDWIDCAVLLSCPCVTRR